MPANSSDKTAEDLNALKAEVASGVPWSGRALMLALNFIPMLLAGATGLLIFAPYAGVGTRIGIAAAFFYLFPPAAAQFILSVAKFSEGQIAVGSAAFFAWWATFQLQVLFCRFPALEEALRLVPG